MNRYLVTMCIAFVSACGLVNSDESLAPFPADGVAAFQEASPIEVCLGTARIIAPTLATGATALCLAAEQKIHVCSGNSDCTGFEKCICGRCIVEPCQGGSVCSENEVCRGKRCTKACATSSECNTNERCISGGCARACVAHKDCHYGERCDSLDDVCVVSLCGSGATCGTASNCESIAEIGELGEPTYLGDEPVVFVELDRDGIRAIFRATITSPNVWRIDPPHPVLEMPGESGTGAPSVLRRGAIVDLYAAVGTPSRIVRAHSNDDGLTFVVDTDPILAANEPWENGAVGSPSVIDFDGVTYLFYEGGPRAGIGLAKITSAGAERISTNPILFAENVQDPIFWRAVSNVGAPQALVVGNAVRVMFTARGVEGFSAMTGNVNLPPEKNDSIGLAATVDMKRFTLFPTGPIYARLVNLRAYLGESEANLRLFSTGAEMVFVASDASGEANTGLMRVVGRGGAK